MNKLTCLMYNVYVWQAEHIASEQPLSLLSSTVILVSLNQWRWMGSTHGGGGSSINAAAPPPHQILKINKNRFVDMMLSNVLFYFDFSQTQPLKLADD